MKMLSLQISKARFQYVLCILVLGSLLALSLSKFHPVESLLTEFDFMVTSEITPVVEKRKERASIESRNQQDTSDVHKSSAKWPTMKELVDPKKWPAIMKELVDPNGPFIRKWKVIFLVSCVLAVLLDPLFLYIPLIINEQDIKCLRSDNKLKIAALVLRSVTDLCYLLNIFFQVYSISTTKSSALRRRIRLFPMVAKAKAKTLWRSYICILIDILAVLPIPQIIILIFYFNTRGDSRSFSTRKLMNFFVLVQYVPRVLRIYLSCKEFEKSFPEEISLWLKGLLNFFLFILASHVIGAFWYFFAIQQIATCWQYACRPKNGCDPSNLYCHDHHALRNIKIVDDLCSVDPPNEKLFKIGIFHDVIQLGILGSTDFFEKFSNCFWWGLRNLSSFGSNLNSSINAWENIFGAFISIIGLLLFLYLIGNLQTYMQLDTAKSETQRLERRIAKKMKEKGLEVDQWLSKNGIPSSKKSEIMVNVEVELKENKDFNVENILSILPLDLQCYMNSCMPLNRLKKVPLLQNMDEGVLTAISEYLVPKKYTKDDIIIQEKEPLKMMIFIVEGHVIIGMGDCSSTLKRSAGEVYGEKLLSWPAWTSFPTTLPVATESARADGDVEALVLMASDIQDDKSPWSSFRSYILSKEITCLTDDAWELLESDRVTMLRKVPKLKTMNGRVLKDISKNLKPMKCERDTYIITEGKPLRKMVFVTEGSLSLKKDGGWTNEQRHKGEFYGEELLDWVLDRSFPAILPISIHDIWVHNAEVLVLTAKDLGNFESHFSKDITSPTDSSLDLCATVGLTWLKKGPSIFQSMEEEMLKVISKHLKFKSYSVDTCIVQKNNPLEYMFIFIEGSSMSIESTLWPCTLDIGGFYGQELVHWVTYWSSHTSFPDKLPLSTSNVKVGVDDTGNAGVLVLGADDLKSLVSKFWWKFIKPAKLLVDSEGKLLAFDLMATLKQVQELEDMDDSKLEEIRRSLVHTRYDTSQYIIQSIDSRIDKMFVIVSGVVSIRSIKGGEKVYRYSGDYCGDELLDWALRPSRAYSRNRSLPKSDICVEAVGDVQALVLQANDLKRLFPMPSRDDNINSVDQHVGSSSEIKGIDDNVDSSKVKGQKITEPSPIVTPSPPRPQHVGSSSSSEQKKIDDDMDSSKGKGKNIAESSSTPRTRHVGSSSSSKKKKIGDDVDSSKGKGKKIAVPLLKLRKGIDKLKGTYEKFKEEKRNRR